MAGTCPAVIDIFTSHATYMIKKALRPVSKMCRHMFVKYFISLDHPYMLC